MEKLIYSPQSFTHSWDEEKGNFDEGKYVDCPLYLDAIQNKKIGDRVVTWASAPGTGRWVHEITRMDDTGVYGIEIENTIRELEVWEVI